MNTAVRRRIAAAVVLPLAALGIGATVMATSGSAAVTNVAYNHSPFNSGPVTITFTTDGDDPFNPNPIPVGSTVQFHRSGTSLTTSDDFYSKVDNNLSPFQTTPETTVDLSDPEAVEKDPSGATPLATGKGRVNPGEYDVSFYDNDPRKDNQVNHANRLDGCSRCVSVLSPGAPTMTTLNPSKVAAGANSISGTLKGTNLARGTTVQVQPITGNSGTDVRITNARAYAAGDTLDLTITVPTGAPGGVRDVLLTNTDGQTSTCTGCFTVLGQSLTSVAPTRATNNDSDNARQITFSGPAGTVALDAAPRLDFVGNPGVNTKESLNISPISGTAVTRSPDGASITAQFNLAAAAPGDNAYQPSISSASTGSLSLCTCRFSIDQPAAPTVTSVSPAAQDRGTTQVVTVGGTNFSKGANVTIVGGGATTTAVEYVSRTQLKATISVAAAAAAGKRDVKVDLSDIGTQTTHTATCTACYTINGNTPAPTTSSSPTGSPKPSASCPTSSASPTRTSSPSASATASATATPSATATATTSASSSASSTASSTGSPAPSCATLSLAVSPADIVPNQASTVLVHGSPNQPVQVWAYSRPSTTYAVVRSGTTDANGNISWTVTPGGNTRLYAHYPSGASTASTDSPTAVITVHTSLSLSSYRDGVRKYHFQGTNLPRRAGQLITLYRYAKGPKQDQYCVPTAESDTFTKDDAGCTAIRTATAFTNSSNTWRIDRTFSGSGRFYFVVRTSQTNDNGRGHSNQRLTIIH